MREKHWTVQGILQICCMCLFSLTGVTVSFDYTLNRCYIYRTYFVHIPWVFTESWNNCCEGKVMLSLLLISCCTEMIPTQTRRGLSAAFASWGEDLISGKKKNVAKPSSWASTSLHDSLCLCTAEDRSSLKQGLAFCHLDFVPPQDLFPLTSPTSTFHNLKNKFKPKVLDLCFSDLFLIWLAKAYLVKKQLRSSGQSPF